MLLLSFVGLPNDAPVYAWQNSNMPSKIGQSVYSPTLTGTKKKNNCIPSKIDPSFLTFLHLWREDILVIGRNSLQKAYVIFSVESGHFTSRCVMGTLWCQHNVYSEEGQSQRRWLKRNVNWASSHKLPSFDTGHKSATNGVSTSNDEASLGDLGHNSNALRQLEMK